MKFKSFICLILALLFIVPLAACEEAEPIPQSLTINEFLDKYKRADLEEFISDTTSFLKDLESASSMKSKIKSDFDFLSSWNGKESSLSYSESYEKEIVLFNQSAVVTASLYDNSTDNRESYRASFYITFDTGDKYTDFRIAEAVTDGMIALYGDPTEIHIGSNETSEAQLRKIFAGDPQSFDLEYSVGEYRALTYFSYGSYSRLSIFQ